MCIRDRLYGRRGLTGALQAHEHDDIGNAVAKDELALGGAEHLGCLLYTSSGPENTSSTADRPPMSINDSTSDVW